MAALRDTSCLKKILFLLIWLGLKSETILWIQGNGQVGLNALGLFKYLHPK